jgi:hypothetical protein
MSSSIRFTKAALEKLACHPSTGLHYVHIFPMTPVFEEIRERYDFAAKRLGWMSAQDLFNWTPDWPEWQMKSLALVFWGSLPEIPKNHAARVAFRHTESTGQMDNLVSNQQDFISRLIHKLVEADVVFAGCPAAAEWLRPHCRKVALGPIGYDPVVMGTPNWSAKKQYDLVFCGTPTGRRKWILPEIGKRNRIRFARFNAFGRDRTTLMDSSRAVLHVGHSDEPGFPGMRLWQAIASSAALLTEPRDAWPAVAGRHYIELPKPIEDRIGEFLDAIERALAGPLEDTARVAHEELSKYTVERCMNEFFVPAIRDTK